MTAGVRFVARAAAGALLVLATSALAPAVGAAQDISGDELRRLVQRASSDPEALARLRRVDRVDGRPLDLGRALHGADGEDLRARLRSLGAGVVGSAPAAGGDPRAEARRILDHRKFRPANTPQPFRGMLRRLGDWLEPVLAPLGRAWGRLFGDTAGTAALAVVAVGVAALVSLHIVRRRTSAGVERSRGARGTAGNGDPEALERQADDAQRNGNLDLAFRLRFRAGLLRLDRAGVVTVRPALTTGELVRRVPSVHLRGLAGAFEEITYGGRPARPGDLDAARARWPLVLEEATRR